MAMNWDDSEFWDDQEFFSDSQSNPQGASGSSGTQGSLSPSDAYAQHVAARQARLGGGKGTKPEEEPGAMDALVGGAKRTLSGLETAFNVVTGDDEGVHRTTKEAEAIPQTPNQHAFMTEIQRNMEQHGDDSVWDGVKNVARATWAQPKGAFHEMVAQLPNSAAVMGGMFAGAKMGFIAGNVVAPGAGGVVGTIAGGIAGMFFGNVAIEGGFIAQDQSRDGTYDREDVMEKAAKKAGVITGIDVATIGTGRHLFSGGYRAVEKALAGGVAKDKASQAAAETVTAVMKRHGVDPDDLASTLVAMASNKTMMQEIRKEGAKAYWKALPTKTKAALGAAGVTLESVGEGAGEYLGSLAAGLDASFTEAVMEAAMSIPQSVGETAVAASLARMRGDSKVIAPPIPGMHPGAPPPPAGAGDQPPPDTGQPAPGGQPPAGQSQATGAPAGQPQPGATSGLEQAQQPADPVPVPEPQQTLEAQLQAVVEGRKPAMLVTPGAQIPENIPTDMAVADLGAETGYLVYPRSRPELLEAAKAGQLGEVLGYGTNEKPQGATDVVTAYDADGNVIQDVVTDGNPEIQAAADQVAGPGGATQVRPAEEALAERIQTAEAEAANVPQPKKLQAKALLERLRKGEISLDDYSKAIAGLYASEAPPAQPDQEDVAGDAPGLSAAPSVAQEETGVTQQFTPTHELSDGTLVASTGQPGLWLDAEGNEIEDGYAEPIVPGATDESAGPAVSAGATAGPADTQGSGTVSPEERAALTSDRRQQDTPVEEDRREGDRRQNTEAREDIEKAVEDMTDEEKNDEIIRLRQEARIDELTGLGSKKAYDRSKKKNFQAFIDADGLKWINDNLSHEAGDALLVHIGRALKEEFGDDAYHVSGDEFIVQGAMKPQLKQRLDKVIDALAEITIEADNDRGETFTIKGVGFSYGIDKELAAADQLAQRHKEERTQSGLRSGRGEAPPGVSKKNSGQGRGDQSDTAEEETLSADEFDDILNEELAAAGFAEEEDVTEDVTEPTPDEDENHGYPPIGTRVEMKVEGKPRPGTITEFEQDIDDSWLAVVKVELPGGETEEIYAFDPSDVRALDDQSAPKDTAEEEDVTEQDIDAAADEAATSPNNDIPEPTPGQKDAENYKVGRVEIHGLQFSIENPRGSYRFKVDQERIRELQEYFGSQPRRPGYDAANILAEYMKVALLNLEQNSTVPEAFRVLNEALTKAQHHLPDAHDLLLDLMEDAWHNQMPHHYARILGTLGADGDHVDAFIGPDAGKDGDDKVFVIDQIDPKTGKFDEHKVMIGFKNNLAALQAYKASYDKDWKGLGGIKSMTVAEFKEWLAGDTTKPLSVAQKPKSETKAPGNTAELDGENTVTDEFKDEIEQALEKEWTPEWKMVKGTATIMNPPPGVKYARATPIVDKYDGKEDWEPRKRVWSIQVFVEDGGYFASAGNQPKLTDAKAKVEQVVRDLIKEQAGKKADKADTQEPTPKGQDDTPPPKKQEKPATKEMLEAFKADFYGLVESDADLKTLAKDDSIGEAEFTEAFAEAFLAALDSDTVTGWVKARKYKSTVVESYRELLKDPDMVTFAAKIVRGNLNPKLVPKDQAPAPMPSPTEIETWRNAMIEIAREYQKIGDTDNAHTYANYYSGRYQRDETSSVENIIKHSRERLEERRQEIEKVAEELRNQVESASDKELTGLLKEHAKNHYLSKIVTDQMIKNPRSEVGRIGRYAALSYLLDAGGYPFSAAAFRSNAVSMNKKRRKSETSARNISNTKKRYQEQLRSGTFKSAIGYGAMEPVRIPSEKEMAAVRRITKQQMAAIKSALVLEHDVIEAARAAAGKDAAFQEEAADAVRAWIGEKGEQALVTDDPISAQVYAGMLVEGGAALNPVLFTDKFFADLHKKAKAAIKQSKPPKKKPDADASGKESLQEAAGKALEQALAELNLPEDRAQEFAAGWNHVIGGGTQSNLQDRAKEQVRNGYQAAIDWMKSEERNLKGKKQGSTGVVLKRVQDMRNKLNDMTGGHDNELNDIFKATARIELLPADLVPEGATPGLMRLLDYVRSRILPFKEWLGDDLGGGRRRWQKAPEKAIRDAYKLNPQLVIDAARQYSDAILKIAEVINSSASAEEASRTLTGILTTSEIGKMGWHFKRTEFGSELEPMIRQNAIWRILHDHLDGRGFFRDEDAPYDQGDNNRRKPLTRPRLDRVDREGFKDYRQGKNITPKKFKDTFGFSDVTIGKSVTSREEQDHLNYAYDALMDLAETLGIHPLDISFRGWMHFSIGALGHGRFAAHFQRAHPLETGGTVPVINLTNKRGDGTLSHEWFHALDFFLRTHKNADGTRSVAGETPSPLVSMAMSMLASRVPTLEEVKAEAYRFLKHGSYYPHINKKAGRGKTAPKIEHARFHLAYRYKRQTTDFKKAAELMDKGSKDGYWAKPTELFARAAEAFVLDTMKGVDTYLVNDWVAEGEVSPPAYRGTPYPTGDERTAFNSMFGALLESIDWTPEGPVIKSDYDLGDGDLQSVINEALQSLEKWQAEVNEEAIQKIEDRQNGWRGGTDLAKAIFRALETGTAPKDNNGLKRFVEQFDGEAPSMLRMKEAQEDYEAALSQRARKMASQGRLMRQEHGDRIGDDITYRAMMALYEQQPLLNLQTTTSSNNQAYSTPAPIAYLASRLAGIGEYSVVWEPTAGNGMLVMEGTPSTTHVNEIEERRYQALRQMGISYTYNQDATEIVPPRVSGQADVVIMNPPFGALKEPVQIDGYKISKIDHLIAAKQLAAMKDDGRAVLILGANKMAGDIQSSDRIFFNWLYENYTVEDHFEASGDLYTRQGAGWPIRIIVISGRAKSDRVSPKTGTIERVETYEQLYNRYLNLKYGADVVVPGAGERTGETAGPGGATAGGRGTAGSETVPGSTGESVSDPDQPGQEGLGGDRGSASALGEQRPDDGPGLAGRGDRGDGRGVDAGGGRPGGTAGAGPAAGPGNTAAPGEGGRDGEPAEPAGADLGISADEFDSILEEELAAAGVATPKTEKPDARKAENIPGYGWMVPMTAASEQADAILVDGYGWMVPVSALEKKAPTPPKAPPPPKAPEKTPKDHLKDAASETAAAFGDAFAGLNTLFGGHGKLGSGLSFDEETYAKAKPLFIKAVEHAIAAGKSLKEAIRGMIQMAIQQWGANVKPYLQRFSQQIQAGEIKFGRKKKEAGTDLQADYPGKSSSPGITTLTPVNQAQAIANALEQITDTYGDIDEFVMQELGYKTRADMYDAFMGHQVDGVALAIHQIKTGGALIIGDQTGVGKGRQAAAIIRWAKLHGYTPVFITAKPTLYTDMHEDLAGIGSPEIEPLITNQDEAVITPDGEKLFANKPGQHRKILQQIADTGELPDGKDALFTTYDQLQARGNIPNIRRQVIDSLAGRAVFILDEAHKAAGQSGTGGFIRSALAASGRAVYLSATYAKRPDNMPLYFLTDMSKATENMDELIEAINSGGVPLMEIVSNQLAAGGQFVRRELSWEGISLPTWYEDNESANERNRKVADQVTMRLRAIVDADRMFHSVGMPAIIDNIADFGGDAVATGNNADVTVNHANFTSVVHNALAQMLLAIKAERVAEMAIEAAKAGEKPVIALDSTMGSFLQEHAQYMDAKPGSALHGFDYRVVLSRLLRRTRRVKFKDKQGKEEVREIPIEDLPPEVQEVYNLAMELIQDLDADLFASPIDLIRLRVEQAGLTVKEVTGRDLRVDYTGKLPTLRKVPTAERKGRVNTVAEFNNGKLDVIIMNVAGSTGISMHSHEKFKDTRPRRMIVAQAALDINVFMQMLGRINRNGQKELPLYRIFSTMLPAEKRPNSVLSAKMKKLNANTSSNEKSSTSVDAVDLMNKYGDEVVARFLDENPDVNMFLQVGFSLDPDSFNVTNVARNATGRLALMPVDVQQDFYDRIEAEYVAHIEYLNSIGANDLVTRDVPFEASLISTQVLHEGKDNSSPFLSDAHLGKYSVKKIGKPPTAHEVKRAIEESLPGGISHQDLVKNIRSTADRPFEKLLDERTADIQAKYDKLPEEEKRLAKGKTFDGFGEEIEDFRFLPAPQSKQAEEFNAAMARREFIKNKRENILGLLERKYVVGNSVRVTVGEDTYSGVITGVKMRWKQGNPGNPYVEGGFTVTIMVNGGIRRIALPISRLESGGTIPGNSVPNPDIDYLFKRNEMEEHARETRYIVTGNLLAAYGEMTRKGEIIRFTMADGSVKEGMLMPKTFDPVANVKNELRIRDAQAAYEFFLEYGWQSDVTKFGLSVRDKSLRVTSRSHGGIKLFAAGSAAKGGKWWKNERLTSLVGTDFAGTRSLKELEVPPEKVLAVLELIFEESPLYALKSMEDIARDYIKTNRPKPEGSPAALFSRARGDVQPPSQDKPKAAPTFYSQMQRVLDQKLPGSGNALQMKQVILAFAKKGEFKAEELEWSGVEEWLAEQGPRKITKAEVLEFMRANEIDVQEKVLRPIRDDEGSSIGGVTKFDNRALPGGENYREMLLTLPQTGGLRLKDGMEVRQMDDGEWNVWDHNDWVFKKGFASRVSLEAAAAQDDMLAQKEQTDFRSTHFDEPNILAHVRFNERADADGNRVLFIEEVQSDWHQAGRKHGYGENEKPGWTSVGGEKVPDAPFKTTWPLLAMKRMIRYAAENGFDRIAWTTGEQQADRYDLSKQVDYIDYVKSAPDRYNMAVVGKNGDEIFSENAITIDRVEEVVGKDVADKIAKGEGQPGGGRMTLRGLDLKAGGAGMKGFYDKILPNEVNKYAKKWGGKVGETVLLDGSLDQSPDEVMNNVLDRVFDGADTPRPKMVGVTVHALDVTPAMRDAAMQGQPMFSRTKGGALESVEFKRWFGESKVVDENGEPLVVYHGTGADFAEFNRTSVGGLFYGMYFSPSPQYSGVYAGNEDGANVMPVYLSIKNPLIITGEGVNPAGIKGLIYAALKKVSPKFRGLDEKLGGMVSDKKSSMVLRKEDIKELESLGYDGIINRQAREIVAFHPEQIKSAIGNQGTFDPSNPDIRFSRQDPATGSTKAAIDKSVEKIVANWAGGPKIEVVQSVADLPKNLREFIEESDQAYMDMNGGERPKPPEALFDTRRTKVWLIADALPDGAAAQRTLLHESVGHYGLRRLLGRDMLPILRQVYFSQKAAVEEIARRYGLDLTVEENRLVAAEEVLAHLAEENRAPKILEKVYVAVLNWLRRMGFSIDLTKADLYSILAESRKQIESGKGSRRKVAGQIAMSRRRDTDGTAGDQPAALFSRQRGDHDPELQSLLTKIGAGPKKSVVERIRDGIDGNWRGRAADLKDRAAQASVDQFHGIKAAEQALGLTDHDRSSYTAARMSTSVDSQLMVAMMKGPLRWLGNRSTFVRGKKGLLDILQPVADQMELWEAYMVARRAERLMGEGRENWLSEADIERGRLLGEQYPIFQEVARDWAEFNKAMLDYAQDAGLIDPEGRKLWEHDDYIPFYRIIDDTKAKGPKGRRGLSHQTSGIKRLRGADAQINDILENMIMNTAHLIEASMKNHAMRMAVNNMMDTGLMTPAPFKFQKELIPMSQIKTMLEDRGVNPDVLPTDMLEGIQKMWALKTPTDKNVVKVMIDGKPKFYYVHDELLLRSLTSIDQQAWGAFMDIFRAPKRWLTTLVTADPAFQAANFIRDTLQAFILSRENITPILSGLKGARKALTKSDEYWEMLAAGGGFHSGFVNAHDPGSSARIVKAELRHKGFKDSVISTPRKLWDRWMEFGSAVENANRVAVYEGTIKAGKSKLAAAYEAKDFMDFSMRGDHPIFNFLAQSVPFFNARLQGIYRLGRGMSENPSSFAARGMLIALAGLALWGLNKDDDRYKDLEEWDKDTYWHFWVGEEHWRFPKPFEVGFIFGTLPERMFEAMYRDEDDAGKRLMDRMLWNVWQVFNLGALPQTVAPAVEQVANRDFFRDAPIVGMRLERLSPEAQFTPWTHETSIQIGRALGVSPARVDHLLQGYFGTLGDYALTASDYLVRKVWDFPDQPAKGMESMPVAKRFYRGKNERATRYSSEFYDLFQDLDKTYNTIREYAKTGDRDRAEALLAERKEDLAPLKMLRKANERLQKISNQARLIHLNRMMSPEEKQAKLQELQDARNQIYKEAVTRATSGGR